MYARQRNGPGNGYRSNLMGNAAAGSRISPEGSMRGHHRNYNPEFRNYNRGGYARGGHSKQFQPPLPPPRETDVFVEAGKLAAEYLVSRGVLPPNALAEKWQNTGLKNPMGDFQGFRPREVENTHISTDRVGNVALDVEHGRRRYSDEYNSMGTRNFARESSRTGSFKNYGSEESSKSFGLEVKREFGKSGSFAERSRAAPGMRADRDVPTGHEQHLGKDGNDGLKNSSPGEITQGANAAHLKSELEKGNLPQDTEAKASSFFAIGEVAKDSDDANQITADCVAVKEEKNDNDMDQINDENKEVMDSNREDGLVSEVDVDLVKHSKFENVPTKARSSLTVRGSKSDLDPMNEDPINEDTDISEVAAVIDVSINNSTGNASSDQDHEFKNFKSDVMKAEPVEKQLDVTIATMHGGYLRSGSFPEDDLKSDVLKIQELGDLQSGLDSSNSMFMDKGGKRAMSDDDTNETEVFKKLREWVPQMNYQFDGSPPLSSSMENQPTLQEPRTSKGAFETPSDDQSISLFPKGHADTCDLMEEKQLFPGPVFRAAVKTEKETVPIDVDLSMSNNCNLSNKNGKQVVNNSDIEIIDLEDDSGQEDKGFSYSQRRGDAVFSDLEGFHNSLHNANEIPDAQDGYGLMISEFLRNSSPNRSSVATGLNTLHHNIVLPDEEGILGDDDSIYMSLGEIPISHLGPWEPPTQDYGKPF